MKLLTMVMLVLIVNVIGTFGDECTTDCVLEEVSCVRNCAGKDEIEMLSCHNSCRVDGIICNSGC